MQQIWALLLDTVGIQSYCFSSNKLRENLGASAIVKKIYREFLWESLGNIFGDLEWTKWEDESENVWTKWEDEPENIRILKGEVPCEIGYVGGGNALIFFSEKDKIEEFIYDFTKSLLLKAPSIVIACAWDEFDLRENYENPDIYKQERKKLFSKLQTNKNYLPITVIPQHGITTDCSNSGFSADVWYPTASKYISAVSKAKVDCGNEEQGEYDKILGNEYCFTKDLKNLGQMKGEDNHIAIIHIDGNDMGQRFNEQESLQASRKTSLEVSQAITKSFEDLLKAIDAQFVNIKEELPLKKDKEKFILPLREVVKGGDDITFVANAKFGIYFAKLFIEALEKNSEKFATGTITSCAGVAIIKTSYPFYRGYKLAEQLCSYAKRVRKEKELNCSWLDFHISMGGFFGELQDIRDRQYLVGEQELLFRPYPFCPKEDNDMDNILEKTLEMKQTTFPKSKQKELRNVLTMGEEQRTIFVREQIAKGRTLPQFKGKNYHENLFIANRTPYFDILELKDFFPDFALGVKK